MRCIGKTCIPSTLPRCDVYCIMACKRTRTQFMIDIMCTCYNRTLYGFLLVSAQQPAYPFTFAGGFVGVYTWYMFAHALLESVNGNMSIQTSSIERMCVCVCAPLLNVIYRNSICICQRTENIHKLSRMCTPQVCRGGCGVAELRGAVLFATPTFARE